MYQRSIEDPAGFWADIASQFYWKEKWDQQVCRDNLDIRKGKIQIEVLASLSPFPTLSKTKRKKKAFHFNNLFCLNQWFKGGITNICHNCLDRNIESGNGDKIAIYWEGNEPGVDGTLTYNQLLARVCQVFFHAHHPLFHNASLK